MVADAVPARPGGAAAITAMLVAGNASPAPNPSRPNSVPTTQ